MGSLGVTRPASRGIGARAFAVQAGFTAIVAGFPPVPAPHGWAAEAITIAGVDGSADAEAGRAILEEVYGRLGIPLVIRMFPPERALRMSNGGRVDGELQRIDAVRRVYKNLIQVQPAINFLEASVFTSGMDFPIEGWGSLRPYRIGVVRGIKFAEANTVGMTRSIVDGYPALFRMLERGRLDVGVMPRINGLDALNRLDIRGVRELRPAIILIDLFHYLHKKNSHLVPRISAVLEGMKRTGELAEIRDRVNATLLEP